MPSFFVVSYIISLTLSVITFITGLYVGLKRIHTVRILPRALRLYLMTNSFPFFTLSTMCSMYIATYYLLYNSQVHFTIEICRIIVTFSSQQIRISYILTVVERIVATVKLEDYTHANENNLFWKMTIFSYTTSAIYVGYTTYAKNFAEMAWVYNVTNYYVYCAHIFMLTGCAVLYFTNRKMYKLSAYRITLKKRYTIAQNVKSITYMFPSVLIYALFAQFGSMINIFTQTFNLPTPPVCIFHYFFNLSYLCIYFRHYCVQIDKITTNGTNAITIRNPLGKNIPININGDQYFQDLQHQWK